MAITNLLAVGAAGRTATYAVPAGSIANLVVYAAAGQPNSDAVVEITITSTGAPTIFQRLTGGVFTTELVGPGTYNALIDTLGPGGVQLGIDVNV